MRRVWPGADRTEWMLAVLAAKDEAERKAARALVRAGLCKPPLGANYTLAVLAAIWPPSNQTENYFRRERGEPPRVRHLTDGSVQLVLRHRDLAMVRTATLNAQEVRLLARHPAGAWALGVPTGEQVSAAKARKGQ